MEMLKVVEAQLEALHRLGAKKGEVYGAPVARKLSMLLRPTFTASPGKTLVWADFSNIEARVLPWLAASRGAEAKLAIFREVDRDKTKPDVYIRTAGDLLGVDAQALWAAYVDAANAEHERAYSVRQSHGKVPELSLGFGGGLGALLAMATTYGVYLDERTAADMVVRWREANAWARSFWGKHNRNESTGLWGAACSALESPDTIRTAGRIAFVYDKGYLGGTLFCALPCGRLLTYPSIKWAWREVENKKTGKVEDRFQLVFLRGYGRSALWYGKFAENVTQAAAASVLRRTLKRIEFSDFATWMPVVMHTHDEIVCEVDEALAEDAARTLYGLMVANDTWDEGLPLAAEVSENWFYSKNVKALDMEQAA